ncbi:MAG: SDR family NAD(P)-dependent oxidoreductase [Clostridia bacterium]|nr:SDR family NAD(P)-dependent oxidoreductase [Clostridia bacterium]
MGYVLITGATGGLGKEFCRQLINTDDLFLTGRTQEKLLDLKAELLKINPSRKIEIYSADLTDFNQREELFCYIDKVGIKFSGLINVAGVDTQKEFLKYTHEKIVFQVRVNLEATLAITHAVLKRREKDLKILTVSSISGTVPMPYFAIYSATKASLINFFDALKSEVKDAKITTLLPGAIPTREDIKKDILIQGWTGKASAKSPEYVVKKGLKALNKNKRICVPGAFNKFVCLIEKITPRKLRNAYIAKKWKNKEKDAF